MRGPLPKPEGDEAIEKKVEARLIEMLALAERESLRRSGALDVKEVETNVETNDR